MSDFSVRRQKIRYQDFILFPLFVLLQYFSPLFAEQYLPFILKKVLKYHVTPEVQTLLFNTVMLIAQLVIVLLFIFLTRDFIINHFQYRWIELRRYIKKIIIVYILWSSFIWIYQKTVPLAILDTQNYIFILSLLTIGGLTPIVEEILFRHLLIGELGKKWGYLTMSCVSILLFGIAHFLHFQSIWTFLPFILGGITLTYVYLTSNRNLLVVIALHMLINTVSHILNSI
ncbi:protease [Staphylococcus schleiferi]|uniref:CPBP family intramembrane glutamic endopeptidase n=1 Tax=Staphylococcus coagulans TaxID=74706 RepID=UPI00067A0268|nr:type II CAAX endopeptidase family protein [Staphylococcus coagulans]AKS69744.1 protease [Staphylococcus schleiferi]AKS71912.1 protease [Staphylococcus schleiferi]AKS74145.1 protease [Staphylococcus schleiferi]MBT2831796.1 CPBP family intramembrane metalloprotease [Staphylococcus coagulans]